MKFIFVITNLAGGGAEKVLLSLAEGLAGRGHGTEIILLENRIEHVLPEGLKVSVLGGRLSKGWLGKRLVARRLRKYVLAGELPDMLVSALPFANEVAVLADLPNHWCRIDNTLGVEIGKLTLNSPAKAKRRIARYQYLYNSRPLIAISDGMLSDLRQNIGITGRIDKIANPFDFSAIRRAGREVDADLPTQPYAIHVGRFNTQKRHDLLLDAWKQVNTNHLLVLLVKSELRLVEMIRERGLQDRVVIAGFKPNPYPWIASASLLVLASDHEGLPGVLIEALILGTPAVSTDCPSGPSEILADFPECLVPCGDAKALAHAIEQAIIDPPDVIDVDLSAYSTDNVAHEYEWLAKRGDCLK